MAIRWFCAPEEDTVLTYSGKTTTSKGSQVGDKRSLKSESSPRRASTVDDLPLAVTPVVILSFHIASFRLRSLEAKA